MAPLEIVEDSANLSIRVLGVSGIDLCQAREEFLLVRVQRVPGSNGIRRIRYIIRQRIDGCHRGVLGQNSLGNHARKNPLAISFVACVEFALVLIDVILRSMMRCMIGAGAEPHVPRLRRIAGLLVADHANSMVSEVLREVIPLLWTIWLINEVVVFDEVGIPLVRLAAEEAVVAVEPSLQRPIRTVRTRGHILLSNVMVFAKPECAPSGVLKNLPNSCALCWKTAIRSGEPARGFGDRGHAVEMVVTSGKHR